MQINENGSNCIVDRDNRLSYCEINAPELTVPSGVKFVGRSVMMHNKKLKRLVIPEGVESIEPYAFADCPSLTEIVLPSTLKKIEGYSFDSCVALKSVVLPDGLEYLGDNAFAFCMSLKSIYVPASVNAFGMTPFAARSPGLTRMSASYPLRASVRLAARLRSREARGTRSWWRVRAKVRAPFRRSSSSIPQGRENQRCSILSRQQRFVV